MSSLDITTEGEEQDTIAQALGHAPRSPHKEPRKDSKPEKFEGEFCAFCGAKVSPEFDRCSRCAKGT